MLRRPMRVPQQPRWAAAARSLTSGFTAAAASVVGRVTGRPVGPLGEASALRREGADWLPLLTRSGTWATPYTLNTSRVDYALARDLYGNRATDYKLGASFAKPIVNTAAAFAGIPSWTHPNEDVQRVLDDHTASWTSDLGRLVRNCLRDGDVFARIDPPDDDAPLGSDDTGLCRLRLIPPEWVTPIPDPLAAGGPTNPTAGWREVVIAYPLTAPDASLGGYGGAPASGVATYTLIETLTPTTRSWRVDAHNAAGAVPPEVQALDGTVEANPYGRIPIVHFRNEPEDGAVFGTSELEPVEPFLKAYHDTLLRGCQGHHMFANPMLKFNVRDKVTFMRNNFTTAERAAGATAQWRGHQSVILGTDENADLVHAPTGIEATDTLLNLLFFNIVDVSECPEYVFGTAVRSSRASVEEQNTPLNRKIERKRGSWDDDFRALGALTLLVRAVATGVALPEGDTQQIGVTWPDVTEKNEADRATTVKTLVDGLVTAMEAGLLSVPAAAATLREQLPAMQVWEDPDADSDEQRRVEESVQWLDRVKGTMGVGTPQPPAAAGVPGGPTALPVPDEDEEIAA